ncbi:16225_t:CDS:2, partial [Racocetra persica]
DMLFLAWNSSLPLKLLVCHVESEQGSAKEEFQVDWMLLAEMGPDAIIDSSSNLGSHDID